LSAALGTNSTLISDGQIWSIPLGIPYLTVSPVAIGEVTTCHWSQADWYTAPMRSGRLLIGQLYNLPLLSQWMLNGSFTEGWAVLGDLNVLGDGNQAVIQALSEAGSLLKEEPCILISLRWRTEKADDLSSYRSSGLLLWRIWLGKRHLGDPRPLSGFRPIDRITAMVSERSDWVHIPSTRLELPIPVFSTRKQLEKRC